MSLSQMPKILNSIQLFLDLRKKLLQEGFANMSNSFRRTMFAVALVFGLLCFSPGSSAQEIKFDSDTISGLGARNIGSAAMSGRVSAIAAVKEDGRLTVYVGSASGGVWKSSNGGTTFKPVFDKQDVQSIGAIAIDPSAPKTIWVGTGEAWTRNSTSVGDGIYKSTDGGDRKSTRLNSSHEWISYAVFCLKKKKKNI